MGMYFCVRAANADQCRNLQSDPDGVESFTSTKPIAEVQLEKAWHGLHFLLRGSVDGGDGPLAFLLQGGQPVGEDLGYGPARLIPPSEVPALDAALTAVTDQQLWSRFDAETMEKQGVYPGIWDEDEADLREEYLMYFHQLKDLVGKARAAKHGLVLMMM